MTAVARGRVDAPWDVSTWAFGPARPYRINSLYRTDRAVVTVTGRLRSRTAAVELGAALAVFERLPARVVVDLCHAELGDRAAAVLVAAGRRRHRDGRTPLALEGATADAVRRLARADR